MAFREKDERLTLLVEFLLERTVLVNHLLDLYVKPSYAAW